MKVQKIQWRKHLKYKNCMQGWIEYHNHSIAICEIIDYGSYKELVFDVPVFADDRYSYEVKELTKLAEKYWKDYVMTMTGKGKNGYFKTSDLTDLEKEGDG